MLGKNIQIGDLIEISTLSKSVHLVLITKIIEEAQNILTFYVVNPKMKYLKYSMCLNSTINYSHISLIAR